jgi:L,D-peptidoglycan transpeptidase YkuD (ErfK/YbiS/YcfS/YnhG family)
MRARAAAAIRAAIRAATRDAVPPAAALRAAAAGVAIAMAAGVTGCSGAGSAAAAHRAAAAHPTASPRRTQAGTRPGGPGPARFTGARPRARAAAQPAAGQLVVVSAASYGATYAALTAYQRSRGRWRPVFGPWTARIGNAGMAAPGSKREGDGHTPSGTFGFGFFFGALPDPGVTFRYRQAYPYDVWDDDPSSPLYNEWVDDRYHGAGAAPEPMDVSGYDYGAVIAYNTARTPGLGSAIFLHVNIGTATTGCVTLPMGELLDVLRWLRPARSPRIELGVAVPPPGPVAHA